MHFDNYIEIQAGILLDVKRKTRVANKKKSQY